MSTSSGSTQLLNSIDVTDLSDEIGPLGMLELALLQHWLTLEVWPQSARKWQQEITIEQILVKGDVHTKGWVFSFSFARPGTFPIHESHRA